MTGWRTHRVTMSATSTMRSEAAWPLKTFATLRITGDRLMPDEVSPRLRWPPTLAYAKGEHYWAGPRSPDLIGRTGVWHFCTGRDVQSTRPADHLQFLLDHVVPREQPQVRWF